jgi:hypothetical protein
MSVEKLFPGTKSRMVRYEFGLHAYTLVGGTPSDPEILRKMIKARLKLGDKELQVLAAEALELTEWRSEEMSSEQLDELTDKLADKIGSVNTFKKVDGELVYEGRQMKAAIIEAASACYPGSEFPGVRPPGIHGKKGFRSWCIEMIEVLDKYMPLGKSVPDIEAETRIKHITGREGPQSVVTMVDIVEDVEFYGTLQIMDDAIKPQVWRELWDYVCTGGIGADRARGDGRCELIKWAKVA